MRQQLKTYPKKTDNTKAVIVFVLFFTSIAIVASGLFFCIYSYINQISFKVINTNVSGIIFGLAVAYLGVRFYLSVRKLKEQLYMPESKFSWSNFKKRRTVKSR